MTQDLPREFIDAQPLGSLAFPHLEGRQRKLALELSHEATIRDTRRFVREAWINEALDRIFTTQKRVKQLSGALAAFDRLTESWLLGERHDPRYAWVAESWLNKSLSKTVAALTGIESQLSQRIRDSSALNVWLPFISLELILEVSRMRAGDRERLELMLSRANRRVGEPRTSRPWHAVRDALAALPSAWLYQFDPCARSETILERLDRGGLTNVGHIAALHPEAWQLMRKSDEREWRHLKRALDRAASSEAETTQTDEREGVMTRSAPRNPPGNTLEVIVELGDQVLRNRADAWRYLGGEGSGPKYPESHITGRQLGAIEAKHRSMRRTVTLDVRIMVGRTVLRNRHDAWMYLGGQVHSPKYPDAHITGRQLGALEARLRRKQGTQREA